VAEITVCEVEVGSVDGAGAAASLAWKKDGGQASPLTMNGFISTAKLSSSVSPRRHHSSPCT
jgi:hypothetical protein